MGHWTINGVEFTGTVITVGVDKDYTTLLAAVTAGNLAGTEVLYLIDAGKWGDQYFDLPVLNHTAYIRGMGTTSSDTVVNWWPFFTDVSHTVLIENIQAAASWFVFGSCGNLSFNKCILSTSADGTTLQDFFIDSYYTVGLIISSSTLNTIISGKTLRGFDLGKVSLSKVAYNIWVDYQCTGTYILDDKAVVGTSGYGESYGDFQILFFDITDVVSISISPKTKYLKPGESQQITVTGVSSNGSSADITADVTLSSSAESVATISASGVVKALSVGMAGLTATYGALSATALIVVQNVLPETSGQIVSFAARNGVYRSMEYKTKRYKFRLASLSCIKVIADKYPVEIDVIYPSIKRAQSVSITSSRAQRIKSALVDCCEVVIRGNSQVSAVFLASSMDELPL